MTLTCPYCRSPFGEDGAEDAPVPCPVCGTLHHADCLAENGGCTVFGCAQAPLDEPKINVSTQDIARPQSVISPPPPPPSTRVAPPPRDTDATRPAPPPRISVSNAEFAPAQTSAVRSLPTLAFSGYAAQPAPAMQPGYTIRKSRVAFVLLAVFLGFLGIHNFYAGYIKKAVIQCCISVFTIFMASPVIWIWAVVEACMIDKDDDGVAFT